jgi:hypothetical protein
MARHRPSIRGTAAIIVVLAALSLLAVGQRPAYTDDIDLLRFTTAKPYVFFIIDNSASMNMAPDGKWVHANGDDPRSKMYQVKKVLYEVLKDVNDIHFGYSAYNQDNARAQSKHWLYYFVSSASNKLPAGWPIAYPAADNDGPIVTAANGAVTDDIEGDLMTFGKHLDITGILGTCATPLPFGAVGADDRETINRYAKLGALGNGPTAHWIKGGAGNKTYLLTVERPLKKPDAVSDNPALGKSDMDVKLTLKEVKSGATGCAQALIDSFQATWTAQIELTLWTDFLMFDEATGRTAPTASKAGGVDQVGGFWNAQDILADASCNSGQAHSGTGWEGNYDTTAATVGAKIDPYCQVPGVPSTCSNLKRTTIPDPDYGRPLDKGDLLPFDWRSDLKAEFLQRFAPNHGAGTPDFRIASYFKQDVDAATGVLPLNDDSQIPLFAAGPSPLGMTVTDFRCWYLDDDNKCKTDNYPTGWSTVAAQYDSEWGCRKPYLIVVSDGGDSCAGPNPCSETANLANKAGTPTWVIAYGANCAGAGNPLKCMAQNGKGELLCPANANDLKTELERILGLIRQEARSFASAAVPSVQAIVEDKIFLTNFTPLNGKATWDGHVHSFLKPLPLGSIDKKPDVTHENHVWDAGEVMVLTQVKPGDPTGPDADQRRVYYAQENTSSAVPAPRRLFEKTAKADGDPLRYDLWQGLDIPFTPDNDPTVDSSSEAAAQNTANAVIAEAFNIKKAMVDVRQPNGTTIQKEISYVLGDIFHSNPLVVGDPPNVQYFASNLNDYQEYAEKHALRRKMLLVGANDGMLHGFDAGKYSTVKGGFDNGTGKELFAYIPRDVLPKVKLINTVGATNHQWGVDGTVTVADIHIDPLHNGIPDEDEREWRTVGIGGLREGGALYYAIDITQPDQLNAAFVPLPANGYVPSCSGEGSFNPSECGPIPFASVLWEFDDSVVTAAGTRIKLDEEDLAFPTVSGFPDGNGRPDMGESWSTPNVGRIRVAVSPGSDETRDVHVAIFGGGLDPSAKTAPQLGTWIYIVDIETGKAIYKRQLLGGMPSEPAAVDTNSDGYLDRIYAGTTAGRIYRIDLTADILNDPNESDDDQYPALEAYQARRADGDPHIVQRIPLTSWRPRVIFNASTELGAIPPLFVDRPIYFRPSVVFNARLGAWMIVFGTGDRDDLWNNDGQSGRFFVFLDDTDSMPKAANGDLQGGPLDESDFQRIGVDDTLAGTDIEGLPSGKRGWYLVLDTNERVINDAFALSGVAFFSTFKPRVTISATKEGPQCAKTGLSRIFIVSTLTADPFVQPPTGTSGAPTRYFEVPHFVTNPFAEQGQTKNESDGVEEICDDVTKMAIMESLKSLFPDACKFGNYRVDIKTIAADTSLVCIAPVPVCLIEKNWKEW